MAEDVKFIINTKVEISWSDGYYKSNIEDVQENYIAISIPIKEGQYIPLRVGEQLEVIYYPNNEDIYKFNTVVVGRQVDRIPIILLGMPVSIMKIQRRKFVRVPVVCNIECSVIDKALAHKELSILANINKNKLEAILLDLSGGGMRVRLNADVKLNDTIVSYIPIEQDVIIVKGVVVRIDKGEDNKCAYGINFLDLNEKTRDKIIRFIFQLMRDQMRKV
jgi:c-di-GMP-binding flagellar brake protein YcgR